MSASTTFPVADNANNNNHRNNNNVSGRPSPPPASLERKFELLERRFTQPIGILHQSNSNSVSPHPSNEHSHSHSNLSEHSFSFRSSNQSSSQYNLQQPTMTIRSKRNSSNSLRQMTSLDIVNRAAAEHMRKVASSSPLNGLPGRTTMAGTSATTTTTTGFATSNSSCSSHDTNSQQTVVAGNRTQQTQQTQQTQPSAAKPEPANGSVSSPPDRRVVEESPPVRNLVSPARNAGNPGVPSAPQKPNVARALPIGVTSASTATTAATSGLPIQLEQQSSTIGSASKRKSVPKRKISSINDAIGNSPIPSIGQGATTRSRSPHKQRANYPTNTSNTNTTTASNAFVSEHSRDRSNNSNPASSYNKKPRLLLPPANNKRIHDFFSSSKKKQPSSNATASHQASNNNATNNIANGSGVISFPSQIPPRTVPPNSAAAGSSALNKSSNTPRNDASASIHSDPRNTALPNRAGDVGKHPSSVSTSTSTSENFSALLATANASREQWRARCAGLQQKLQDKDQQLKAVTGNKTILHTALQQALTKTRTELASLKESKAAYDQKARSVLAEALRWKFQKEAKELRASLAADGNRLGRIVSTRAGMRVIDSWEEGCASKDWQLGKEKWKQKRTVLLEKQATLQKRLRSRGHPNHNENNDTNNNGDPAQNNKNNDNFIDNAPMSQLDVQEAQESIQMHLEALLQEEKELLSEEQALNDEKGAHIRALKRVASEDASRFKNRGKLHDRYVLDCLLGKGGFSEVWKGYDLLELREVAVKIHQLDPRWPDTKKENYTKHVSREYEIHRNVRHPRIVSLYDVFEIDNNSFATVLEYCKGTDLDTLLKRKKRLPERQARAILLQILTGMQYLSQPSSDGSRQGIIHYDLKPGNILFDEFGDAKITDFGLSKIVDAPDPAESMELTSQGAGTYWYLPPECFVTGEQVRISNKVDVWSIGVIFYQMLYGQRPFGEGKSQDKLLADHTMLNAQEVHLPDKPSISDAGKEFVKQCLTYDQAFRPTIAQLCETPYVLQKGV
ncbi:unnamed protein product [Pseudo-nitzschia multistriata]|uniref:Protein kinase domain-containing protein n=1 Tax=Pseudo-nitzschia multistriata TaxID=183589 RepID=A0A448ZHX0_9STRA|nr:unnamed protein product [Pseudo-nitzschia multistriata]